MPKTYAELYKELAQAKSEDEKQLARQALLTCVRDELDSPHTEIEQIKTGLEVLQTRGTLEDIQRIDDVVVRHSLDGFTLNFAREVKRHLQERCYLLADISRDEEDILRTQPLTPKDPGSRWLAVRRGKILAEGAERAEVEAAVSRMQVARSSLVALIVPVGSALPSVHERR